MARALNIVGDNVNQSIQASIGPFAAMPIGLGSIIGTADTCHCPFNRLAS
jgi:hypothetical protein